LVGTGGNKSGKKKKRTAESVNFGLKLVVALIAALGLICFIVGMGFFRPVSIKKDFANIFRGIFGGRRETTPI
jgi:hypothetical protein